jgi:two-component system alkaline phosphatase synthesis response regulator PhoP
MAPKILIADDEPNILMLTSIMLEDCGYETILAKNGVQAIERALKDKPDLVITDIVMPEKDGFEVCKTLRANKEFNHVPIIILSAIGDEFNKITGFEGGADDYITKPFNLEDLKNRVQTLLMRSKDHIDEEQGTTVKHQVGDIENIIDRVDTGTPELNQVLKGGFPKGSNILLMGPIGSGKSTLARRFTAKGLRSKERSMVITLDDAPTMIRRSLEGMLDRRIQEYEEMNLFSVVDAYSWSSETDSKKEKNTIQGILDLNQLSMVIADAGLHLGQSIQSKLGGRRILDSISSLLINFDLSSVQRFLSQLSRTSMAFGMVNSLFLLEEGTVSEHVLNNIKYVMDGVIETKQTGNEFYLRVASMKWIDYTRDWVKFSG